MLLAETKEKTMNEDLKDALKTQGEKVRMTMLRAESAKIDLETFDAHTRIAIKADGVKRTESDTDAAVAVAHGRAPLVTAAILGKADLEGVKTDTQCLLAHVSLVCSETAAMSRITQ